MEDRELSIEIPLVGAIKSDSGSPWMDVASICIVIIVVLFFKRIIERKIK